ncbi:MAG: prolyl oligopeptidase family serine peptidase [Acidobacteriota bacterium]
MNNHFTYPKARQAAVADDYHGTRVEDPYRWLEDAGSPETIAWVDAQNALTRSMLDGPVRDGLVSRLTALYDYPRTGVPFQRGGRYFYTHNAGLQDQPVLYVQAGLHGARRVLLDPNLLSAAGPPGADGPVALTAVSVNDDGTLAACGLSTSGSDRQEIRIRDVATGVDRGDRLRWAKFVSIAWEKDGLGFYYTRFPEPGTVPPEDENYFNIVCHHRLGEPQDHDTLVFARPGERETVFHVEISDDDRWLVITAFKGASDKSETWLLDRHSPAAPPRPLFTGYAAASAFIDAVEGQLFFRTDDGAPRGRIVRVDPLRPSEVPVEILPQTADKLSSASIAHGLLVTSYLRNASHQVLLFALSGAAVGAVALPELGSVSGISGRPGDGEILIGFTSFVHPPANYRYDFARAALEPFGMQEPRVDPDHYETTQVWYPSKDGTKISMFLVHRTGLQKDGKRPVLLSGYGGFNISLTPAFDPANFVLLDQGGIYAVANLRGGGEYGEEWHEAGMFGRKQNVFDDFIAAAEWFTRAGYSCPQQIAIEGGSNGGLLTAAVMVQRPELFGAVVCRVPVADMLRYHLFTVGRFWISEYGSADDPAQFPFLHEYSPLHNVREGAEYPATLIMTADTDDRVSPGMAKKLAARLQAADNGATPVLIRVETNAGHGAGKPVSKLIGEDADIFTFLFKYLDVE